MLASSFVYMNFPPVHFDSLFPGRRNITNGDYSDNIWERKNLNGEWHWKEGSLHDPGFMMNKTTFGRPPPQVLEPVPAVVGVLLALSVFTSSRLLNIWP